MRGDRDRINAYMTKIVAYPRISKAREIKLSRIILTSKNPEKVEAAVNELVTSNLKLVFHCLKDYISFLDSPDVSLSEMDLVSEGNIALITAAHGYDASFATDENGQGRARFSTYACTCVRSRMQRAIKTSHLVRIPERHFTYRRKLKTIEESLGQDATDEQISSMMGIGTNRLEMVRISSQCRVFRFDDIQTDDDSRRTIDSLPDHKHPNPDAEVEKKDLLEYLRSVTTRLKPRTQVVISALYLSDEKATLQDLSEQLHVSRERCRQICIQGLHEMRKIIEAHLDKALGSISCSSKSESSSSETSLLYANDLLFNAVASFNNFFREVA